MAHLDALKDQSKKQKLIFFYLFLGCMCGYIAVFPYIYYLGILSDDTSLLKLLLFGSLQSALLFGFVLFLSYKILPKTDLEPFIIKKFLKRIVYPGLIAGVMLGLTIFVLDRWIFFSSTFSILHPPFWAGALASVYGSINEEVLLRLFFFTFVYFLFMKIFKFSIDKRLVFLWITNIVVALVFGLGHLPAAFKIASPSGFEISRIIILNAIPGLVFGWLYWSRGLFSAIAAHFVTDLMIHVILV